MYRKVVEYGGKIEGAGQRPVIMTLKEFEGIVPSVYLRVHSSYFLLEKSNYFYFFSMSVNGKCGLVNLCTI